MNKIKLTDLLAKILKINKINYTFGLQGGAVVHIFDSLEKYKINTTYVHHEQCASLAATANAKITDKTGCVVVTTGPATMNAMNGLLAAWQDSIPVVFISGQSRSNHTSYNKKVRQVGTQEVNICDVVKPLTKYSKFINNPNTFGKELQKAINIANDGRKGPVWIDLPLEYQWSLVKNFKPIGKKKVNRKLNITNELKKFQKYFLKSKKPCFILGYGLRSSFGAIEEFKKLILNYKIPFVTTWNAADIFPTNHKLNCGIIGMSGQRGANKKVFNSDLLICLGTHLSIPHTTTLFENYCPDAKKVIVNIDKDQLNNLNVKFDLKIISDCFNFLFNINNKNLFKNKILNFDTKNFKKLNWYEPFPNSKFINSNKIVRDLTQKVKSKCIIVDGGGTALYSGFQSSIINKDDRVICSSAISSMGTGLAETLGVAKIKKYKKYICVIGDGSFLMNIQDLQSIKQENINVIILLINNNGYLAIRHTQREFLNKRYFGTHPEWKLKMPNFEKLIKGFGVKYLKIQNHNNYNKIIKRAVLETGPVVLEVMTDQNQESLFKQGYKSNLDGTFSPMDLSEMHPFLKKPIANTNN
jgi:acetolactate synthase-1/2/3 large subunit